MKLKYSLVPTVTAVRGMALGGGCEFQMHCTRTVAALESYIGLGEAAAACPAAASRRSPALRQSRIRPIPFAAIKNYFEVVASGQGLDQRPEAWEMGLLRAGDIVVFNPLRTALGSAA